MSKRGREGGSERQKSQEKMKRRPIERIEKKRIDLGKVNVK